MIKLLFLLTFSFNLIAAAIPTELQLLVESIGNPGRLESPLSFTEAELQNLKKDVATIDHNLTLISDEAALLLIKNEIYKKIVSPSDTTPISFTNQNLADLRVKFDTSKKELAPFLAWMVEALLIDIDRVLNKVELETFLKNSDQTAKDKLNGLLFYLNLFAQKPVEEFNLELKDMVIQILQNINSVSSLLINFSELKEAHAGKTSNTLELLFNLALKNSNTKTATTPKMEESEAIKALSEPIAEPTITPSPNPKTSWLPEEDPIIEIDSAILRKMEDKNYDWAPQAIETEKEPQWV